MFAASSRRRSGRVCVVSSYNSKRFSFLRPFDVRGLFLRHSSLRRAQQLSLFFSPRRGVSCARLFCGRFMGDSVAIHRLRRGTSGKVGSAKLLETVCWISVVPQHWVRLWSNCRSRMCSRVLGVCSAMLVVQRACTQTLSRQGSTRAGRALQSGGNYIQTRNSELPVVPRDD